MARGPGIFGSIGLFILRVGVSSFMLMHGWGKTMKVIDGDFAFADPIGIGQETSLVLAAGAEFACAILVMLGLGTRFAAIPLAFTMLVAAFVAHANDPLFSAGPGASKEPALVFGIVYLALIFTGAGWFSADGLIRTLFTAKRREAYLEEHDAKPAK